MPRATQLQMVYRKLKSDPWSRAGISETQAPGPRRDASSPLAGWLEEVAGLSAGSRPPVLSHAGPWLVWGTRKVWAPQPRGSCPAVNKPTHSPLGAAARVRDEGCCVRPSAWGTGVQAGNQVAELSRSALRATQKLQAQAGASGGHSR